MTRWFLAALAVSMCTAAAPGLKPKDCPSLCERSVVECTKMCEGDVGCVEGCQESSKMCPKMCAAMAKHSNDPARMQAEMQKVIETEDAKTAKDPGDAEPRGGKHRH